MTLYLKGIDDNLEKKNKMFFLFCIVIGHAKVNWKKSSMIWTSNQLKDCGWGMDVGLIWVPKGQRVKYLGVQVEYHLLIKVKFDKLMLSLKGKFIS